MSTPRKQSSIAEVCDSIITILNLTQRRNIRNKEPDNMIPKLIDLINQIKQTKFDLDADVNTQTANIELMQRYIQDTRFLLGFALGTGLNETDRKLLNYGIHKIEKMIPPIVTPEMHANIVNPVINNIDVYSRNFNSDEMIGLISNYTPKQLQMVCDVMKHLINRTQEDHQSRINNVFNPVQIEEKIYLERLSKSLVLYEKQMQLVKKSQPVNTSKPQSPRSVIQHNVATLLRQYMYESNLNEIRPVPERIKTIHGEINKLEKLVNADDIEAAANIVIEQIQAFKKASQTRNTSIFLAMYQDLTSSKPTLDARDRQISTDIKNSLNSYIVELDVEKSRQEREEIRAINRANLHKKQYLFKVKPDPKAQEPEEIKPEKSHTPGPSPRSGGGGQG